MNYYAITILGAHVYLFFYIKKFIVEVKDTLLIIIVSSLLIYIFKKKIAANGET